MLVCLMVCNAPFWQQYFIISWKSILFLEKTTDLSQVTDKLDHIILYTSPWSRFELSTSVVIRTDCIGSCKSTYTCTSLFNWDIAELFLKVVLKQQIINNNTEHGQTKNISQHYQHTCRMIIIDHTHKRVIMFLELDNSR